MVAEPIEVSVKSSTLRPGYRNNNHYQYNQRLRILLSSSSRQSTFLFGKPAVSLEQSAGILEQRTETTT
ncbi:MAG: hypothetical protein AB7G13_17565 [Lautropia sp.]